MPWLLLVIAGFFEIGFALAMKLLLGAIADAPAKAADLPQPFILPETKPADDGGWTFEITSPKTLKPPYRLRPQP